MIYSPEQGHEPWSNNAISKDKPIELMIAPSSNHQMHTLLATSHIFSCENTQIVIINMLCMYNSPSTLWCTLECL